MLQKEVLQVIQVWGWFVSFLVGGLVFYRKHTASLNYITVPSFCHVFYSIFILGQKFYKRKSGKADLECTFYLSKKKNQTTWVR